MQTKIGPKLNGFYCLCEQLVQQAAESPPISAVVIASCKGVYRSWIVIAESNFACSYNNI